MAEAKVDGSLNVVIRNLTKLGKAVIDEVALGAEAVQAKVMEDAKSSLYPGHGFVTGNLQGSIQPGAVTITDDNVEAIVVANANYASWVEAGNGRFEGYYYMAIALLKNQQTFVRAITAGVKRGMSSLG